MMFNKVLLAVSIYTMASFNSWGEYYNAVKVDNYVIGLSKNNHGVIDVYNNDTKITNSCKIENWDNSFLHGAGILSLTSDNIGVLLASSNEFLKTKELEDCNDQPVKLYDVQYTDRAISTLIDINFEEKIILALVVIDAQSGTHQAIVSKFNGKKNILSGKGFWDPHVKNIDISDDTFPVTDDFYYGKISSDGRYVAPNDLDCSADSFPGVWDIEKKKKVVFESDVNGLSIDEKCSLLFSGKKNLVELGRKLVSSK
ncbi:hypothetical protein [Atlantibacter sp.]|uniref:hypothetical protein n=1 Tax=Atlantibacter sp. TaxID=1903473 RepID=UPI002899A267|nr:hypothetical protein [Atlantibacter sp.]